jgi:dGTP triphosphohydrolase
MRKQMIENAAHEVATQVRAVEDSIEAALVEIAELQSRMVRARGVMRANMVASHAAFEQLAATTTNLVSARGAIAHCHSALVDTKQTIPGLRTTAFGDGDDCPPSSGFADLRIVA